MMYFIYTGAILSGISLVFQIMALANLSEYGDKNVSHFFFKFGIMFRREYFTPRGWMWSKLSLAFSVLAGLALLCSPFRGVLGLT
jgi:hypothetical protein